MEYQPGICFQHAIGKTLISMDKNRLEAFSDGVMAIIITIMVLNLDLPVNPTWKSYLEVSPVLISYALSFIFIGLYWSNHHHLFHTASVVNNKILWINMFGLFWLSLLPLATASMGESAFTSITVAVYAALLALLAISYLWVVSQLCALHGAQSEFSQAFKGRIKTYVTIALNILAATISLLGFPKVAFALMILIALTWFIPNHRFELNQQAKQLRN